MVNSLPSKLFPGYDTLIFADTETTGLDATDNDVIELGAVQFIRDEDGTWVRNNVISELVKLPESKSVPEKAAQINGISDEMLKDRGVDRDMVLDRFFDLFQGKTLFDAYNAFFDFNFLRGEVTKMALRSDNYDKYQSYMEIINNTDVSDAMLTARSRVVSGDEQRVSHKLCDVLSYYSITDVENTHRALDDVEALISLTDAFHKERDDISTAINTMPYYSKYGQPKDAPSYPQFKFVNETEIRRMYEPTRVISSKLERNDVSFDVWESIQKYLNEEFKLANGMPKYELQYICRASNHPDEKYKYQVIASDRLNNSWACWTSWNQNREVLNNGHYDLDSFISAKNILNQHYWYREYQGRGEDVPIEISDNTAAIDMVADYLVSEFDEESYNGVYKNIDYSIKAHLPVSLAYTTITDEELDIQAFVDFNTSCFFRKIDDTVVDVQVFPDNASMVNDLNSNFMMDFDYLVTGDEESVDHALTGVYLAETYLELKDKSPIRDSNETTASDIGYMLCETAEKIYMNPASYGRDIEQLAASEAKPLCDRFKDLMDKYCGISDEPASFGLFRQAKALRDDVRFYSDNALLPEQKENEREL